MRDLARLYLLLARCLVFWLWKIRLAKEQVSSAVARNYHSAR
jgi:hypothetical protein